MHSCGNREERYFPGMRRKSGNGTLTLYFAGKKGINNLSRMTRSKIMRITLLSPLALGAVVFAALAEPVVLWAAEPVRLTGTQMDAVTAGAVAVGVGAWATAAGSGSNTYTYTSTSTTVLSTPTKTVDIGLGSGKAVACCGSSTDTGVQTTYYAEGHKVIANSTVTDTSTPWFSFSYGFVNVIAVE